MGHDGWLRIGTKIDTKQTDKQLVLLKHKLQETEKEIETLNKTLSVSGFSEKAKDDLIQMEANAEKLRNQIKQIEFSPNKTQNFKDGFDNLVKSAKKFALSILSIRTAYTILSRASSSYLATDEKTTNQLESNWVGLGTILEPVIKFLVDLMKKAVTSVLYFMSVLTGVDYIAKANANALKKQENATNSLKKANDKLTASFDEMQILNSKNSSSSSVSSGLDASTLFDINDIGEDTRKTINKISEALKPVYKMIKKIIKWALDNPEVIIGILGGTALLSTLGKILGVAGIGTAIGTGLAGILGVLLAIAGIGIITIEIYTIYKSVKEAQKSFESLEGVAEGLQKQIEENTVAFEKYNETANWSSEENENLKRIFFDLAQSSQESTNKIKKQREEMDVLEYTINHLIDAFEADSAVIEANNEVIYDNIQKLFQLYQQGDLTKDEIEKLKVMMEKFTTTIEESDSKVGGLSAEFSLSKEEAEKLRKKGYEVKDMLRLLSAETSESGKQMQGLGRRIDDLDGKKVKVKVDADTSSANNKLNNLFSGLKTGISTALGVFGIKIPKLATGGIINNPGRGVSLGGAIGGEVSKEGVIPLTDSQAMEELGSTIGRYITVNLTNYTNLDGRTISRQQSKVQANKNFAMNK